MKGLALVHPGEIVLGPSGAPNDRRFYVIGPEGRLVNGKTSGELVQVHPEVDADASWLSLRFPDGTEVSGDIALGPPVETSFYGRPVRGRLVDGAWSDALSEHVGLPLQLVRSDEPGTAIDRTQVVSLISGGSLSALGRRGGVVTVDGRRFRMTIELEGGSEHEEDTWIGRDVQVGAARLRVVGPVGRCVITTRNPETGITDLDTLGILAGYRTLREGKSFACGVCGDVLQGGRVVVGDPLTVDQGP